jgi:protein-S-isoprenylcysteine O-methyltransferase Ste14
MYLLEQRNLGMAILALLGGMVIAKWAATGTVLDRPGGGWLVWIADLYKLVFLLVVNPLAAIGLIAQRLDTADPAQLLVSARWLQKGLAAGGLLLYGLGCLLLAAAFGMLGRSFRTEGAAPRRDELMTGGPYRFVRHPMYTGLLCLALGLSLMTQSLVCFVVFGIYLLLIVRLIDLEEAKLRRAYGDQYRLYQRNVRKLVPHVY